MNNRQQAAQRGAKVYRFRTGKTNIEISNFNNIPHGTVRNFRMVWNKFLEDGGQEEDYDVTRAKGKLCSDAHNVDIVDNVQVLIDEDPGCSMRGRKSPIPAKWLTKFEN